MIWRHSISEWQSMHATQAFAARRADIAESLLQRERQQANELQAQVAELQLLLEEQVGFLMP